MPRKPKPRGPVVVPPPHIQDQPQELPPEEKPEPVESDDEPEIQEDEGTELQHRVEPEAKQGRGYKRMGLSDLQARCSEIKNWEDWCLYLYRLSPITDQTVAGKNVSITKYAEPIDETRVMHDFGSGGYRIMANKRREDGSWGKGWEAVFDILNMDFPPKVPPGAWMADQRNARWAWAKPKEPGDPAAPNPNDPLQLLQKVEDMMDRRDARLRDSMQPKESTLDAVKIGLEMARASAPQGDNQLITIMRDALADQREKSAKLEERVLNLLTERANPAHATGPVTIEDQAIGFAKVVEAVDKVRPPKGGGRSPEPDHPGWKILDTFVAGISPGLNALIGVAAQKIQQAGQPAAPQPQRQANRPQQAEQQPAAQQQPVQVQQSTQPEEVRVVEVPAVLQQHFQLAFDKCMQGESPEDFADWLHAGYPTAISELRQIGSENPPMPWSSGDKDHVGDPNWGPLQAIMDIARHQPVWKFVAMIPNGEVRLTAFVKGVLEWVPSEEEEDEGGVIQ